MIIINPYRFAAAVASNPLITGQTLISTRNDFAGFVGCKITVGAAAITVTDLGRWIVSGNSGSHLLKIVTTDRTVTVASVTINTSGLTAGAFSYVSITPVVLSASTVYHIFSEEFGSGDSWYEQVDVTYTGDATVNQSAYDNGAIGYGNFNACYVPVNIKYHL